MGAGVFFRRAFNFTLLLTLFLVPLIFIPFLPRVFAVPKNFIFQAGTMFSALFLILSIVFNNPIHFVRLKRIHKSIIFLLITLFLLIVISTIVSSVPSVSLWGGYSRMQGAIAFFHYFLFGSLIFTYIQQHEKNIKKVLRIIIISAVISSFYAIAQKFSIDTIDWDSSALLGRVFGTLSHPNMLAQYLAITLPLTLSYIVAYRNRIVSLIAFLIQFAALILTQGRTSAFALLIAILVFIYFASKVKQRQIYFRISISLFIIFVFFIGGINIFRNIEPIKKAPVLSRLIYNESNLRSIKVRGILWSSSIPLVLENPILGHGADTLKLIYPKYKDARLNTLEDMNSSADRTHNELLDIAIFFGLPALFIYLVILGSLSKITYSFIKHHKNYNNSIIILGLFSGLVSYFLSTLMSFSLTTHYMLLAVIIAALLAYTAMNMIDDRVKYEWEFNRFTGPISTIAIITIGILTIMQIYLPPVKADFSYKEASILLSGPDSSPLKTLDKIYRSAISMPAQSEYAKSYADIALSYIADEDIDKTTKETIKRNTEEMLNLAIKHNPLDSYLYVYAGTLQGTISSEQKNPAKLNLAIWNFRKAIELNPSMPDIFLRFANIYYDNALFSSAIEMYEKYLSSIPEYWKWKNNLNGKTEYEKQQWRYFFNQNPNFDQVLINLGRSYASTGDFSKAIEYLEFASDLNYEKFVVLGDIYKFSDEYDMAVMNYEKALELSPDNPIIIKAMSELGQPTETSNYYIRKRTVK